VASKTSRRRSTPGRAQFSSVDFGKFNFYSKFRSSSAATFYAYLCLIRDHETQHVPDAAIADSRVSRHTGETVHLQFRLQDARRISVTVAALLENTGVMAYDGALNQLQSASLKPRQLPSPLVEARHASYLNCVGGVRSLHRSIQARDFGHILAAVAKYITALLEDTHMTNKK